MTVVSSNFVLDGKMYVRYTAIFYLCILALNILPTAASCLFICVDRECLIAVYVLC